MTKRTFSTCCVALLFLALAGTPFPAYAWQSIALYGDNHRPLTNEVIHNLGENLPRRHYAVGIGIDGRERGTWGCLLRTTTSSHRLMS